MSIQDIANVVNQLNRALVALSNKVGEHNDQIYNLRIENADLTRRIATLEAMIEDARDALTVIIKEEK